MRSDLTAMEPRRYAREKIKMLEEQFGIILSETEKSHFLTLPSDIKIDNYARSILKSRL